MYRQFITALIGLTAIPAKAAESVDVAGVWVVQSGNAIVEIIDCGNATPCGKIAWVNAEPDTSPKDDKNPDPNLRDRPLVGSALIWGFNAQNAKWISGKIYDAESGKTYNSKMELLENGTLKVKGCIGPICQGQVWTPVTLGNDPSAKAPSQSPQ